MKNLVFIDTEASYSKDVSSICCVSLIMVDSSSLKEISKKTLYINSETTYDNWGSNSFVNIDINPEKIKNAPTMPEVYEQLKEYLNDNYIIVGHAVANDVRMLNKCFAKYNLPILKYSYLCSQMLYLIYKGDKENKSLEKVAGEIGKTFTAHHCEEDVAMSLETVRYICEKEHHDLERLLKSYDVSLGLSYKRKACSSSKVHRSIHARCEELFDTEPNIFEPNEFFTNKYFSFDEVFEKENFELLKEMVIMIKSHGGFCTSRIEDSSYFIGYPSSTPSKRKKYLLNHKELLVKCITPEELKSHI